MVKRADGILKFHPIKEESPVQEAEIVGIYQVKEKIKPYMSGDTFRSENIIFSDLHFPEKVEQDDPLYEKAYFKAADVDDYEAVKEAIRKTDIDWRRYDLIDNNGDIDTMASNFNDLEKISNTLLIVVTAASFAILFLIFIFWIRNRTNEIGILMALGIAKGKILLQIISEAFLIGIAAVSLSLLAGLCSPVSGSILYNGEDIRKKGLNYHRRHDISLVFQNYNLIDYLTTGENVKLGGKKNAEKLLQEVGIPREDWKRNVLQFSGGQQQCVAIARALASESKVLLADEPTGNLDEDTAAGIIELLKRTAHGSGKCVIVVTHSRQLADMADEFLSGLHKDDRLHPIISIVIYYNEKPWDGPKSLKDLVAEMPEEISQVFSDYRMNLLQVGESERYHFNNEDVQDVFETARHIYKGEFNQVKEMFGERNVKSDVGAMIGVMTDSDLIIERAYESKGGMNMCTALEKLEEKGREEGKREMIFAFLKAGAEFRVIKEASGLSDEEIEKLRKEMKE